MANKKGIAVQQTIITLYQRGYSIKRIKRELGVARNTVRGYVREYEAARQNDPPITGSGKQTDPGAITGSKDQTAPPITGSTSSQSKCEAFREEIEAYLDRGLHAVRIHQDLAADHGFTGSYSSVRRFVRNLRTDSKLPYRRLECEPGEEAQIDFGQGAWVIKNGKRRRPHLFRIVLSHSRKAYSEVVWRQDTESFIRVLENAFRHFGGVPEKLVPDNLKAVVTRADWYDPEIHRKIRSFCEHYGTVMLPTKPRTPRHKGKVERAIDYAQENALKGRSFESLEQQNRHLREWEAKVADHRIHGTTRRQVQKAFEAEKPHLQPLPPMLFPCFFEGTRKCGMDGHVEVEKAYYSVPPEFTRREVAVRWDGRMVRIFDPRTFVQVRVHPRMEPGRFSTNDADVPPRKRCRVERGEHFLLRKLALVSVDAEAWGKRMLQARGLPGVRVLQGLLRLTETQPVDALDHACREAVRLEAWHLRELKTLLHNAPVAQQLELPLQQSHPVIRSLDDYAAAFSDQSS